MLVEQTLKQLLLFTLGSFGFFHHRIKKRKPIISRLFDLIIGMFNKISKA